MTAVPKNRAQHIVHVIDGLGRVPRLREMGHVHLDLLSRHVGDRHVAEPRQQVLLQHEETMLLATASATREGKAEPDHAQSVVADFERFGRRNSSPSRRPG